MVTIITAVVAFILGVASEKTRGAVVAEKNKVAKKPVAPTPAPAAKKAPAKKAVAKKAVAKKK